MVGIPNVKIISSIEKENRFSTKTYNYYFITINDDCNCPFWALDSAYNLFIHICHKYFINSNKYNKIKITMCDNNFSFEFINERGKSILLENVLFSEDYKVAAYNFNIYMDD